MANKINQTKEQIKNERNIFILLSMILFIIVIVILVFWGIEINQLLNCETEQINEKIVEPYYDEFSTWEMVINWSFDFLSYQNSSYNAGIYDRGNHNNSRYVFSFVNYGNRSTNFDITFDFEHQVCDIGIWDEHDDLRTYEIRGEVMET